MAVTLSFTFKWINQCKCLFVFNLSVSSCSRSHQLQVIIETKAKATKTQDPGCNKREKTVFKSNSETQEVQMWLTVDPSAKLANVDVLALPRVAVLRSVFLSPLKAHRAFTPARCTAAFSQGLRSLHPLPPLPHSLPSLLPLSFLFSCQDCNQAFSLWPRPNPPPHPPSPRSHQQTKLWEKWRARDRRRRAGCER